MPRAAEPSRPRLSKRKEVNAMTNYIARVPTWAWTALTAFAVLNVLFWSWD